MDLALFGEILRWDLGVGLLGGIGAALVAADRQDLATVIGVAAQLIGAVMASVIAAMAILASFMDSAFLRKLKMIGRRPNYFLAPFMFTALLSVLAAVSLLVLSAVENSRKWVFVAITGVAGLLLLWTLLSLIPDLVNVIDFLDIKMTASEISDDIPNINDRRSRPPKDPPETANGP